MSNLFDGLQKMMFNVVTNTMGYNATWQPAMGGTAKTGRVLLKEPTGRYEVVDGVEYTPFNYMMEYQKGVFDGLIDAIRDSYDETVNINGIAYYVRKVEAVYDGKTYRALLEKI